MIEIAAHAFAGFALLMVSIQAGKQLDVPMLWFCTVSLVLLVVNAWNRLNTKS